MWPELEAQLKKWIVNERENGRAVSTTKIRIKAQILAQEIKAKDFQGGPTWCYRFMKRNFLTIRSRSTVGQKLPDEWREKSENFLMYCKKIIKENNFSANLIFNMDEVPLSFDIPPTRTVEMQGTKSIPINTTGNERTSFTVVLCCAAGGEKLPPMLIFTRKTLPKDNFPKGIEICVNEKGWMNEEVMISWLKCVWRKRKDSFFKPKAFLIMDSMKAHLTENVKSALKSVSAKVGIIPGGLTKKLQPLDVGINRSFKSKVRILWEQWMSEGNHSYTKTGKLRRASYEDVSNWVIQAWNNVSEKTIKNAFRKCNIIEQNLDPEEEDSLSSDSETEVKDAEIMNLFISDSDESDFEGFI